MIKFQWPKANYWLCAWSTNGDGLSYYEREGCVFETPAQVQQHALKSGSTKFGATGLIFLHIERTANSSTMTHFHTLAAANRFHKAQATAKASDLTKSQLIRKALRKELNKQPA